MRWFAVLSVAVLAAACSGDGEPGRRAVSAPTTVTMTTTANTANSTSAPRINTTTTMAPPAVGIRYRLERRTTDDATADFEAAVVATLADRRGWTRAGYVFDPVTHGDAPYLVVLAEGDEVDRLCLPYDTYGEYSCQNGPVVALNADRWRRATDKWTGDLLSYRQMLVNHEVGHLLGMRHPRPQCPRPGEPAPIMNQQSTELDGCLPNPWPLDGEIEVAARHDRKLAPGPGE